MAPRLPVLIRGLTSAGPYPHDVAVPVRVAETHISWILLTGQYAYKIKKPLRLSFLDYSTLAKRRHCCEEEIRLNSRYAPGLYLRVAPIGGTEANPRMDATGEPLEYAVCMRQFQPSQELRALLAAHALATDELTDLGRHVAAFHAAAAQVPTDHSWGQPQSIHQITLRNFAEIRGLRESGVIEPQLSRLAEWVDAEFARISGLMLDRRADGWVRECHGDLHSGNVVRWEGALVPFDGIDFDPALRFIDVVSDVAFLAMDLDVLGRPDLASAFLNGWTEALGDFAGLPLLPYYRVYRALVRAKVAALKGAQAPAASHERRIAVGMVRQYLRWAEARIRRPAPRLLITTGLSGSGKTWIARGLAARLGALHVRSDVERKRLAGLKPLESSRSPEDGGIYTLEFNDRTYARLRDCARDCLSGRETVIVDAAFLRRHERRSMIELARSLGVRPMIVHCHAPDAVLRSRIEERLAGGRDASEASASVLERQYGHWEPFASDERPFVVDVDTSMPAPAAAVLRHITGCG